MNLIDPRTVVILSGAMCGLMCLVYYSLRRKYPASIQGLSEWSLAMLLFCIGDALFAARGALPDVLSIPCSILLIHLGLYIALVGTQRLFGVPPRHSPYVLLLALVFAGEVWFLLVQPSFAARLRISNLAMATLFGLHARVILQQPVKSFGNVLTAGVLCLATLIQLLRFASSFALEPDSNLLNTSPQNLAYLIGFALSGLLFSISSILMTSERLLAELEQLAIHDPLTNALTRRHMQQLCEGELSRCLRHGQSMALLMMDLDHFKHINDLYGHQTGDRVLVAFVGKINASLRQQDQLGRFGGEEFVALLPQTSQAEAERVAQRICEACAVADALPVCTVSVGISTNQGASDSFEAMLSRADAAMYRAKANGRNQVAVG
jgi:diguanylate cyclase (GGDEF)-like protein